MTRYLSIIPLSLALAVLPSLSACHRAPVEAPLSAQALAAVRPHPGAEREELARAIDSLFTDPDAGDTRALVILRSGSIVAERYETGFGPSTRFQGWSMSKSVTAMLIGLLVADGRLRLDSSVPIPLWQRPGDSRSSITLRQLLQMRSGLENREIAHPPEASDTVHMLFLDGRDDMASYAESQPLMALPGRQWNYSTATSVILSDIAARTLTSSSDAETRHAVVAEYLRTRLFEPADLGSMVADYDAAGTMLGGSMIYATARDWGRFGELLRNHGAVHGAQIVPKDWIRFMTSPSPRNPGYGAQIWLNHPQIDGKNMLMPGRASADMIACIGHLGQYILILPKQKLTIVRLGHSNAQQRQAVLDHLAHIIAVFRAGDPSSYTNGRRA